VRIRKNDDVIVIAGKDKGKTGKVLATDPKKQSAVVEGVNFVKKHTRANPQKNIKGGIVEREGPVHVSNLMVIDPESSRPTRVSYKRLEDGRKVRVAKRSGAMLDSK
jgi:large subunit ribosomal protein L24